MRKFLKLFFGCHSLPARSFYWKGKQFPICARCTGEAVAMVLEIILFALTGWYAGKGWCIVLTLPLVVDGVLQWKTKWFSNNPLRFITGLFFGIAIVSIFIHMHFWFWEIAKSIVMYYKK